MNPAFLTRKADAVHDVNMVDIPRRIGIGKEIIEDPEDFDKSNNEIADLFEDVTK